MRAHVVVAIAWLVAAGRASADSQSLRLDVSLLHRGAVDAADDLVFRARLRNVTSHPVLIVATTEGVICPAEVLHDGMPVVPTMTSVEGACWRRR